MAAKRSILQQMLADEESGPDGLALAGWGFAAVIAFLFAAAAWQFAETPQQTAERLRLPDAGPVEITGSIGAPEQKIGIYGVPAKKGRSAMEKMLTEDLQSVKQDLVALRRNESSQHEANAELKQRLTALEVRFSSIDEALKNTREQVASLDANRMAAVKRLAEADVTATRSPNVATRTVPLSPNGTNATKAARQAGEPGKTAARVARADGADQPKNTDSIVTGSIPKSNRTGSAASTVVERAPGSVRRVGETSGLSTARPNLPAIDAPLPTIDGVSRVISDGETGVPKAKPAGGDTKISRAAKPTADTTLLSRQSREMRRARPARTADAANPDQQDEGRETEISRSEFGIDLGGFQSMSALKTKWQTFAKQNPDLAKSLQPRAGISEKNGALEVRLIAGPFSNAADAIILCAKMGADGKTCQPALYSGETVPVQ